jgi:hypothetical protein
MRSIKKGDNHQGYVARGEAMAMTIMGQTSSRKIMWRWILSLFGSDQSDAVSFTKPTMNRASHLAISDLRGGMDSLEAGQRGYITFKEYQQLSGEKLDDEFSSSGRDMIAKTAATAHCEIIVSDAAQRVYFSKKETVN